MEHHVGRLIAVLALLAASAALAADFPADRSQKVLRYAFERAETTLDPQKTSDVYSNFVESAIFDTPLDYDYLARPLKLRPVTLVAMPEISADGKTYILRLRPGIYFTDDPAFKGRKRELVANDYAYSLKRLMDPKLSAPLLGEVEGIVAGSDEAIAKARKSGRFDYDAPIEGLRALDRYTLQIKLNEPFYNFIYLLADVRAFGAVAREVVEHYGDDIGSHPVGTGPFKLAFWKRASRIVLDANPDYREDYFDAEATDDVGREILAVQKGKRMPMVGRVEIAIIEEDQPRWLSFVNGEMDLIFKVPEEFANVGMPNNHLAPNLAKRGIMMQQVPALDLTYAYFNMDDPVIGGYAPEKVALRRAISLGYNVRDEIAIIRKNQAVPAQTPYSPGVAGHDPAFTTAAGEYSPAKAKALLDMFGYVDRDGDGYREAPDGSPLELRHSSTPTARDQQHDELWKRSMDDIGIRFTVRKARWQDLLKESNAGKLMMWQLGGSAAAPDADTWLQTYYGPNEGYKGNRARFKLAAYDRLYERARVLPDGPERTRLYQEMTRLIVAYAPSKFQTHRILTDMWYPWVLGYRRPAMLGNHFWKYVDIDLARMPVR
ncbi:MAG TPA: ABC transporter substrate-binding protein [Usitatibacter sp.]|jgi:ABC-type transport system substrate-binding protein|nr:ABC transporter substrate-binding protein [Usitatibacter sp.]